ncbi:MAG: DUF6519 domain-containing protein [Anaerolineales bacterium]
MKGDFSRWNPIKDTNFNGVLHQQGRVLTDADWNDQTRLSLYWRDRAARYVVGARVMAIPTENSDAFKIERAWVDGSEVKLEVQPGFGWADGVGVELPGSPGTTLDRTASYFGPPIHSPVPTVSSIADGTRDAVVLEVWREAFNAFQRTSDFYEPALGGPDTTERVLTESRFRLFRLENEDVCGTVYDQVQDDPATKGRLKATLKPVEMGSGPCPVVEGGGFLGFEHALYRIEVAKVTGAQARFKWSQFNAGLVGRGECDLGGASKKVTIKANDQAIKMSGLTNFYMEVIEEDQASGHWRVTYGAEVSLNDDDLEVSTEHYTESTVPSGTVFFRLWNEIRLMSDFPKVTTPTDPTQLGDGIYLEFDAPAAGNYLPGDFWTFDVRAGGLGNPVALVDDLPPQGVTLIRVPLAIVTWDSDTDVTFDAGQIKDCRDLFRPLTNQTVCCTFTVGDGVVSFGDFNDINEALRHLPEAGGKLCLLPGLHCANVVIEGKRNVTLSGCGRRTHVVPDDEALSDPIITVRDSNGITLEDMTLVSLEGEAIVCMGSDLESLWDIEIRRNRIEALKHAIRLDGGRIVNVHHNKIRMLDKAGGEVAILVQGERVLIERNEIVVVPVDAVPPPDDFDGDDTTNPSDDCFDWEVFILHPELLVYFIEGYFAFYDFEIIPSMPFAAEGGIRVEGGSENVDIRRNTIVGGSGNGITLGGVPKIGQIKDQTDEMPSAEEVVFTASDTDIWGSVRQGANLLKDIPVVMEAEDGATNTAVSDEYGYFIIRDVEPGEQRAWVDQSGLRLREVRIVDQVEFGNLYEFEVEEVEDEFDVNLSYLLDFIYDVVIEQNDIANMGLSGIGVPYLKLSDWIDAERLMRLVTAEPSLVYWLVLNLYTGVLGGYMVGLTIIGNTISRCLRRSNDEQRVEMRSARGLGGISLGLGEDVLIRENEIRNNGTDQENPVCGIFMLFADQIDIRSNRILANGVPDDTSSTPQSGLWGGITVVAVALPSLSDGDTAVESAFAAMISDNLVDQPIGRALTLLAFGATSIVGNQFGVGRIGPSFLDKLVGSVLIANAGGLHNFTQIGLQQGQFEASETPASGEEVSEAESDSGASSNSGSPLWSTNLNEMSYFQPIQIVPGTAAFGDPNPLLPSGTVLFNANQTRLASGSKAAISQLILTMDDLGFDGNQSELLGTLGLESTTAALSQGQGLIRQINTVLASMNLRASDNRMKETLDLYAIQYRLSLLSVSLFMNNTTNNQGNHCTIAASILDAFLPSFHLRVSNGNLVMLPISESCQGVQERVAENPFLLLVMFAGLLLGRSS